MGNNEPNRQCKISDLVMELFFSENLTSNDEKVIFESGESRHLTKVLRKQANDIIRVTNGKGLEWIGEIESEDHRKVTAIKKKLITHQSDMPGLHIAIAPTKNNDRMEWFLEKATEIGITEITPIVCDHSERRNIKPDRMKKILVGALKQSARFFLPQLNPLVSFETFIEGQHPEIKLLAHCQKTVKTPMHKVEHLNREVLMMIGPEGDFSEKEIAMANDLGFLSISLGNQRLRTETAGVVACSKLATLRELSVSV